MATGPRRFGRLGFGALIVFASVVSPAFSRATEDTLADPSLGFVDASAETIRFRAEMGLNIDPEFVGELAKSTAPSDLFGIPLTTAEEALLTERIRIQSELAPLKAFELAHQDVWGGTWLSYPTGSSVDHATILNVSLTTEPDSYRREIIKLVPPGADLVVHDARWTERDLDSRHLGILDDVGFYKSLGVELYSVGTTVQDNVLSLELSATSPEIEEAVEGHFPEGMIRVEVGDRPQPDACSRTNCGPPWRSGLRIVPDSIAHYCTAGFSGRYYNGVWNYVLLTGGHCRDGAWHLGTAGGTTIGTTATNYFRNGADVDVQVIPITSSKASYQYLYGAYGCSNCALKPVLEVEPLGGDSVGQMILSNGAATGSSGGILLEKNRSYLMEDPSYPGTYVPLTQMRRASYTRHDGDSGGPVLRAHYGYYGAYDIAAGQHTDWVRISGTVYALYTHIAIIEATTGYDVITAP